MYPLALVLHSLLRWVILIAGVVVIARSAAGWLGKRRWTTGDVTTLRIFSTSLELQILLGVILYVISPLTASVMRNFGGAMSNPGLRFFGVEHVVAMVFALAMVHMGRVLSRRQASDARKHRMIALFSLLAMLVILAAVPWPFTTAGSGRPWIRF